MITNDVFFGKKPGVFLSKERCCFFPKPELSHGSPPVRLVRKDDSSVAESYQSRSGTTPVSHQAPGGQCSFGSANCREIIRAMGKLWWFNAIPMGF